MASVTPMMEQYFGVKKEYKDCIVFFRLGDFYEMFYEDAVKVSGELDLVLTARDAGDGKKAPMCGVPYHSANGYIAKLIEKGFKVAICEQTEDPKATKNIVKREVVRVITPGTVIDDNVLDNGKNNYIMSLYDCPAGVGIACADVSTGEFTAYCLNKKQSRLVDEIAVFAPAEIITSDGFGLEAEKEIRNAFGVKPYKYYEWAYSYQNAYVKLCNHFKTLNLQGFGFDEKEDKPAVCAAGALIEYLSETQKNALSNIVSVKKYAKEFFMLIDAQSRRNLELTETMRDRSKKGSLLWTIDNTKTAMGARMLRKWLLRPLLETDEIRTRLDAVEDAKDDVVFREEFKELLGKVLDIERIMARLVYQTANGRDLAALKNSFCHLPAVKRLLTGRESRLFTYFYNEMDALEDICETIQNAVSDDPPVTVREGGIIKDGYNPELDRYREAKNKGAVWLTEMETAEREKTGIKNLRIRYNKVFGYYIEVSNGNKATVPDRYIRRQTLANCERYTTEKLKEIEDEILSADEKITALEYDIFCGIRDYTASNIKRIMDTANILAALDAVLSLAEAAVKNNYVKPCVNDSGVISIKNGRHPVVEAMSDTAFIANDTYLDGRENRLSIITGPNMAGKSTYMRQAALIAVMAQAGSFVPAEEAVIGVVDRVFTRVGASDDLATGQSTFMVEMTEVANILHNATDKSLLILDEIGRGTSTFDGLSIAWAVLEHIADKIKAKTLFATHYHELSELEGKVDGVVNYNVTVKEKGDKIIFLRKIERGSADNSYGIQVAQLAGVPKEVTGRAKELLEELNHADITRNRKKDGDKDAVGSNSVLYREKRTDRSMDKLVIRSDD